MRWNSWHIDPDIRHTLAYVPQAHDCTIVFNSNANWTQVSESNLGEVTNLGEQWWRFCDTAIHEWAICAACPTTGALLRRITAVVETA
jgi:hypothetical protein